MDRMNYERPLALRVSGLKKIYRLGQIGGGTLQGDLQSWWARKRGKEDPNTKIGQSNSAQLTGQTFTALNDVSFTIHQGEAVGIIGSNGAGKSTLLKLISQITAPTEGEIELYGRVASMLEVGTGFNGDMTGRENVYMNGAILGMTKSEIDSKLEKIIDFSEVRDFIDTPVKRYSSGMYVKLAFSVAAHLDNEILIMDEVLAVGDIAFQKKCLTKMREAATQEGRTVLYVSHNMNTIRQLCDRVIVLNRGKIVFDGDVETGISLYMNTDYFDHGCEIDLSDKRMKHLPSAIQIKMMHITLTGKKNPVYDFGEPIPFRLTLESRCKVENLCVRIEIHSASEEAVGICILQNFLSLAENSKAEIDLCMNLKGLVPGEYYALLVLYNVNDETGTYDDLDAVYPAFGFEVRDTENKMQILWHPTLWGHEKWDDMQLIDVRWLEGNKCR